MLLLFIILKINFADLNLIFKDILSFIHTNWSEFIWMRFYIIIRVDFEQTK